MPKTLKELRWLAVKANLIGLAAGLAIGFAWYLIMHDMFFMFPIFALATLTVEYWLVKRWGIPTSPPINDAAFPQKHGVSDEGGLHALSPYHIGGRAYESYYVSSQSYRNL